MKVALYIVGLLLLLHGIYQLLKYLITISEVKRKFFVQSTNNQVTKAHRFFIFVPVLHEEKTIKKFLSDLYMQSYEKNCFEVCVITTQKEYSKMATSGFNTIDVLNKLIAEKVFPELQLTVFHYPKTDGFKAHQLSYAFEQIKKIYGEQIISESYFLFFDADSEIESETVTRFNNIIEDDVEIYQQPLIWFKNIEQIKDPLMRSFAFSQSFFSISYEIPMFIDKFFSWRLKYFVGHGLCMKGSFILRIGGFPNIIEDVRIGRLSSFLGVRVKLVPGFGVVETAKNFLVYIRQSSVWFFGCGLFISDYFYARTLRGAKEIKVKDLILISYGFFKALRWLNKGLLHLVGIVLAVIYLSTPLLILFALSLFFNSIAPVLFVSNDFSKILYTKLGNRKSKVILQSMLFAPILYTINFMGLYHGFFKLVRFYLWNQVTLTKTER